MRRKNKVYIVYKTTNKINNKIYVGVHGTWDLNNDTYYGSGTYFLSALGKYGKWNFDREVLHIYHSRDVAYKRESYIVDRNFVERDDTYNLTLGGFRNSWYHCHKPNVRKKIEYSLTLKFGSKIGRIHETEVRKKAYNTRFSRYGNPILNCHTPEGKSRQKEAMREKGYDKMQQCKTKEVIEKIRIKKKETGSDQLTHWRTPEKRMKGQLTKTLNLIEKNPALKVICSFYSPGNELILSGTLYEIGLHTYTKSYVFSKKNVLIDWMERERVIEQGHWKGHYIKKLI